MSEAPVQAIVAAFSNVEEEGVFIGDAQFTDEQAIEHEPEETKGSQV